MLYVPLLPRRERFKYNFDNKKGQALMCLSFFGGYVTTQKLVFVGGTYAANVMSR